MSINSESVKKMAPSYQVYTTSPFKPLSFILSVKNRTGTTEYVRDSNLLLSTQTKYNVGGTTYYASWSKKIGKAFFWTCLDMFCVSVGQKCKYLHDKKMCFNTPISPNGVYICLLLMTLYIKNLTCQYWHCCWTICIYILHLLPKFYPEINV